MSPVVVFFVLRSNWVKFSHISSSVTMSGDVSSCLLRIYFFNFLSHFTKRSLMRCSNHRHHRPATHLLDNWTAHKLFHFTSHTTRGANFSLLHFFFSINSTRLCVVLCSPFFSYHVKAHHQQLSIIRTEKQIWVFSDEKFSFLRPKLVSHFSRSGIVV